MTTSVAIPLGHHQANIVLSLLQKLNDMETKRQQHHNAHSGRPMPPKLPAVQCAQWCEDGDGHPDCFDTTDQACWSPSEYVEFSLAPALQEGEVTFYQRIGVMVRREPNTAGAVYLHLDSIRVNGPVPSPYDFLDQSLNLTSGEARALGAALIREAGLLESTSEIPKLQGTE